MDIHRPAIGYTQFPNKQEDTKADTNRNKLSSCVKHHGATLVVLTQNRIQEGWIGYIK